MASFPRQLGRLCSLLIGFHASMTGVLFLFSRFGTDSFHEEHWRYSTPVLARRSNRWQFWRRSFFTPVLSENERQCLEVWLKTMELASPVLASRELSPRVLTQDSLVYFDGLCELRNGVYFLDHCIHRVTPHLDEVRREKQSDTVFLYCKLRTEVELRIPFTRYTFSAGSLPSHTTLRLEKPWYSPRRLVVTGVEHRWFGGPLLSQQTSSLGSPWGDIGDLCRRYNGFMLSAMMTKKISLHERLGALRRKAADVEEELHNTQERELLLG